MDEDNESPSPRSSPSRARRTVLGPAGWFQNAPSFEPRPAAAIALSALSANQMPSSCVCAEEARLQQRQADGALTGARWTL